MRKLDTVRTEAALEDLQGLLAVGDDPQVPDFDGGAVVVITTSRPFSTPVILWTEWQISNR
jgi:hypothetical protein